MKGKTSITLADSILEEIDNIISLKGNRSLFIEKAIIYYLEKRKKDERNKKDLEIINKTAAKLNKEAEDVLSYQVEL
jgi:metal-responsive CopG/Arc/MetJ family transcriptional regulator